MTVLIRPKSYAYYSSGSQTEHRISRSLCVQYTYRHIVAFQTIQIIEAIIRLNGRSDGTFDHEVGEAKCTILKATQHNSSRCVAQHRLAHIIVVTVCTHYPRRLFDGLQYAQMDTHIASFVANASRHSAPQIPPRQTI